jgi:hypothetical protein
VAPFTSYKDTNESSPNTQEDDTGLIYDLDFIAFKRK